MPAETFIDNIDRIASDNWTEHEALHPDGTPITEMDLLRAKSHRPVPRRLRQQRCRAGIKGRYRPTRGFECVQSAAHFCRGYDDLRNFLRPRPSHHQAVSAHHRRLPRPLRRHKTALSILQAA